MVLPAAMQAQKRAADSIAAVAGVAPQADLKPQKEHLSQITEAINRLRGAIAELSKARHHAEETKGGANDQARAFREEVVPAMAKVREQADLLETLCDDDLWPLPKYRELLFLH
jgi:glutamine synthetase